MIKATFTPKPDAATGNPKLATDLSVDVSGEKLAAHADGLQDMHWMMAYSHLCRRSVANQMKKGLPFLKLGRRTLFHPASVEAWCLRQQRGGEQ
jgi:hypothetical protein